MDTGAPNRKLMVATLDRPESAQWKPIWPEQDTVLENFDVTSIGLLNVDRKDVLTRVLRHDLDGRRGRELALPEFGNVAGATYDRDVVAAPVTGHFMRHRSTPSAATPRRRRRRRRSTG